uniref:Tc1-like transposase DDE domain-containing protein n=1 Tax=Esox lucius TaxID=8010 RepID=A0AAY5K7S5_ESOLU
KAEVHLSAQQPQSTHGFTRKRLTFWNGPDLNPIEHLWGDLKRAVHRCPRNLTDLERFCKEEWANIATSRCAMLIDSYLKRLSAVKNQKVLQQSISLRVCTLMQPGYCEYKKKIPLKDFSLFFN